VTCSWMKFSKGRSNKVSNNIRRYVDLVKFAAYMAVRYIKLNFFGCIF
jgi:hypothetical protein